MWYKYKLAGGEVFCNGGQRGTAARKEEKRTNEAAEKETTTSRGIWAATTWSLQLFFCVFLRVCV